ncbi:MAG: carbon-nitrogen family hydrolase [Opitutaceae bacterium]
MKIFGIQFSITWQDKPANFTRVGDLVAEAGPPAGSLIVLPEMFATGFSMEVDAVVDEGKEPTEVFLGSLAARHGCFVIAGRVSRAEDGLGSNEAIVVGPDGRVIQRYRKMHPFSYGGEDEHYAAGREPVLFEWHGMKVCPLVCYDLRFPEVFRTAVVRGAECFAVIANWPRARQMHWEQLLKARAIENQAYVVGVNRVGSDPNVKYRGGSLIIDPRGEVLAGAGDEEVVLSADIDPAALDEYRQRFPALRDIHPDFVRP